MYDKTIVELNQELQKKSISSVELTQLYLEQIKRINPAINAFISTAEEEAIAHAKRCDQRIAAQDCTPLTGIPIAYKDLFCTKGLKTTCGSKMLDNFVSPYNATLVERLENAGMVSLGKTNMDEFAMGSSNESSYYGPVKNPWDLQRVPGGSSGGSAAAVAAQLTPASIGSDTGGSIRQPAAFCGITGIKPTYGRISRYGMVAYASSFDQAGPMARTAEDAALLLQFMAGHDRYDSTSVKHPVPDYCATLNDSLQGLRIGVPKEYFAEGADAKMLQTIRDAIKLYEQQGAQVKEISLPNTPLSIPAYYILAPAEASSNLSRFDGVRYGYRCENPKNLEDLFKRSRSEGFGAEVKRRIMVGAYALSEGYYDAYYRKAQQVRRLLQQDFMTALQDVDVIMAPVTPTTAFELNAKKDDPVAMYMEDIFTLSLNLAGLPGMSIPCGFVNNLPVGLQLIGPYFSEAKLLNIAHQYQQLTDWHLQSPIIAV